MPRTIGERRHVPGKVIDRWIYKVKDVTLDKLEYVPDEEREAGDEEEKYREVKERVQNKTVTLELHLEKTTKQSEEAPHPLDTIKFYLKCDELDIVLEGTDVELLRAAMWSKLDVAYAIKWDKYFLVEVDSTHPYTGWGTGMVFSYNDVFKGTTWDGKNLLRIRRYREEKIEPWPGVFTKKGGKVIACIEATDANEAALEEFKSRVDLLREKLQSFLEPERILATLANLRGFNLLPAPEPESVPDGTVDVVATKEAHEDES
jgi:hypothetical protein